MTPHPDLTRFRIAQNAGNPGAIDHALADLCVGCKRGSKIWFVLPLLAGLGHVVWRPGQASITRQQDPAKARPTRLRN